MSMVEQTERTEGDEAEIAAARRRGWVSLYAVAFGLMLGSGIAIGASSLGSLRSFTLLWTSISLSIAAIVVALAAVLLPRRP